MTSVHETASAGPSPDNEGRPAPGPAPRSRALTLVFGLTAVVMAFSLGIFAWMYWIAAIAG